MAQGESGREAAHGGDSAQPSPAGPSSAGTPPTGTPHQPRRTARHSLTVALVAFLAGALFATNAALFRSPGDRHPQNLPELVGVETARMESVANDVESLRDEVTALIDSERGHIPSTDGIRVPEGLASGSLPVTGPGVVVKLWDAPVDTAPPGTRPDDLVVHQTDLEAVMNALWAGGAEAMTIQGNRVTSRTAVRCVGSVLLMAARTYSPPYEVAVIGDPDRLLAALDDSPGVQIYLQYVDALGLGWSVETKSLLEAPPAQVTADLRYASVLQSGPDEA